MKGFDFLAMVVGYVVLVIGAFYLLFELLPAMFSGIAKGIKEQPHSLLVYIGGILFWIFLFKMIPNKQYGYLVAAFVSAFGGLLLYTILDNWHKRRK